MDIRFGEHPSFHRAALGMVGGSALLGLALHPLTPMAPLVGGTFGLAIGACFGYARSAWRLAAALAAAGLLVVSTLSWPVLAGVAGTISLGLAVGGGAPRQRFGLLVGMRGLATVMFGATVALLAMWTALRFGHASHRAQWPGWATDLVSAAAFGMVGVLAVLPRHLRLSLDPVAAALRALPKQLDAEVHELCERSVAIWNGAKDKLADRDPGRGLVRDGVLKTLEVAAKSAGVRAVEGSDDALAKRVDDLDHRIASATDAARRAVARRRSERRGARRARARRAGPGMI
jgi:hypothetical protein